MCKFLIHALILVSASSFGQNEYEKEMKVYRDSIDREFSDPELSILEKDDQKDFLGLAYFPIDENYVVIANVEWIKDGDIFEMITSTERRPKYQPAVRLSFQINGKKQELTAYKSLKLSQNEEYANYLFLPFTDETNGFETYGGGRYLELDASTITNVTEIDFNKCYNPYCAYNSKYSCPVPPRENALSVKIEAGVKSFDHH